MLWRWNRNKKARQSGLTSQTQFDVVTARPEREARDLAKLCASVDCERARWIRVGQDDPESNAPFPRWRPDAPQDDASSDSTNARFWDELCGSQMAKSLGIRDRTPESLATFDRWYLEFYPYLDTHVRPDELRGARVLEVGLGYGTVSERLARCGAEYVGLDVSPGPVEMVRHRLAQSGLRGSAVRGSILAPPFEPESFDAVVAIGCLHHTGDLRTAITRCRQLLRPGGRLTFMVYYAYSYRQMVQNGTSVLDYAAAEAAGYRGVLGGDASQIRAAYDKRESGEAAPHTDFISRASLRELCRAFARIEMQTENIDQEPPFAGSTRVDLLRSEWPGIVGLDLYASAWRAA
jgi:2-polyprenyl-3-methyl-5-hydroxy-6-metoxy-1,4-benzoquinol methylase